MSDMRFVLPRGGIILESELRPVRDYLFFEGMSIDCIIGLAEWERMVKQTVVLDLKLGVNIANVAAKDQVDEGDLDTKRLSKRLRAFVEESQFRLIETLAENLASLILEEFPVTAVELRLSKPGAIRGADNVGVVIFRGEDE
jgi:7,8-dihydroneopterin aldolase/epimerase/oxygenase